MSTRNIAGLVLILISIGLLVPGLTYPIFHLQVSGEIRSQFANISGEIINSSRSILGTVEKLNSQDRTLVASLIFVFSALVPLLKGVMLGLALFLKNSSTRNSLFEIVNKIAKWSMADVFVVALMLTHLSTAGHMQQVTQDIVVFGMKVPIKLGLQMDSQILEGFYYFLGYCLTSMASLHVIKITKEA